MELRKARFALTVAEITAAGNTLLDLREIVNGRDEGSRALRDRLDVAIADCHEAARLFRELGGPVFVGRGPEGLVTADQLRELDELPALPGRNVLDSPEPPHDDPDPEPAA